MTQTQIFKHTAAILSRLAERGIEIYEPSSFSEVPRLLNETGQPSMQPMMSLERNDFAVGEAFWLFLRKEGRCIGGISAKITNLQTEPFSEYLARTSINQYGSSGPAIADFAPQLDLMKGRLIYFGGVHISKGHQGSREVLSDLAHYARLLAASYWKFDWMYTIVDYAHRRLAVDYGFDWRIRKALSWHEPIPDGRSNDHMILASSVMDFEHLLRTVEPGQL